MQISNIGFWESWRRSESINMKRVWSQMGGALSGLLPWQHTLHAIEGKKDLKYIIRTCLVGFRCAVVPWLDDVTQTHSNPNLHWSVPGRFGIGVKAYFIFLRYLIYLNLLHCALIGGFILGPTAFYGRSNSSGESADYSKSTTIQCRLLEKTLLCCSLWFYRTFEVWRQWFSFGFLPWIRKGLFNCVCVLCLFSTSVSCYLTNLLLSTGLLGSFSSLLWFLYSRFPEFDVFEYTSAVPRWNLHRLLPQSHHGGPQVS